MDAHVTEMQAQTFKQVQNEYKHVKIKYIQIHSNTSNTFTHQALSVPSFGL